jgi:Protein of unknown function (DUF2786)
MAKTGRPRQAKRQPGRQPGRGAARSARPSPAPETASSPEAASSSEAQPGPAQADVAAAIGAAMQAIDDGGADAHGRHLDPLAIERTPGWTGAVSRALVEYLRASVTAAWARGWQPAELARHVGRELSAAHAAVAADMITAELHSYPAAAVDPRWAAQAAALEAAAPGPGAWWGSDDQYLRARYALGRDAEFIDTVGAAVETLQALRRLPAVERLLPLPGTVRAAGPDRAAASAAPAAQAGSTVTAGPADERMLSRIRALLAKAESTEFAREAEALSGRAQELMAKYSIDHALLAAQTGEAQAPGARRIAVDNPYEAQKATLLQTVAGANRCRVVWSRELGLVTVIGFPPDLDAVELLFTSLLVQADAAMLSGGGARRSGSRAFRQSFLLAYAVRIGERLAAAAGQAEREAAAEQRAASGEHGSVGAAGAAGVDLVPFLAARRQAVDEAVDQMFKGGLTSSRSVRATDADGWNSGRAAADQARLHNNTQVAG